VCLAQGIAVYKISKKQGKNDRVSMFFLKKHRKSLEHRKMLGLCHFLPSFF
jgi:hypothetical protein